MTLHCGEICNSQEVLEMLKFRPDRIGHGVCIHQRYGGNDATWELLCKLQIPVGKLQITHVCISLILYAILLCIIIFKAINF